MIARIQKYLVILGLLGLWTMVLPGFDSAAAKDPDYPTRPINFYVGFAPGGGGDLSSRALIEPAGKLLGQPFTPVNKGGAGGTLAAMTVLNSKPDGYTLGMVTAGAVFMAPFSDNAPYKDLSRFTMIVNFGGNCYPLVVKSDAPWKNWKEFIEWARNHPRAAKIGIAGAKANISTGVMLWQVEKREQIEFTYVPLGGTSEMLPATLGGHIALAGATADPSLVEYIKGGKLRILAYLGPSKISGFENIPSTEELYGLSIPDLKVIFGPKGLPDGVVKRLEDTFAKAVKDPGFVSMMDRLYVPVLYMGRDQLSKYVDENYRKFGGILKALKEETAKGKK